MEENNQVIIDIGIDAMIESMRQLQKQYELQAAALKKMKDNGEETSDAYIKLSQEMKVTRQSIAGVEKQMQNEIKIQQANEGSLVQLRAQLANLNKQYDSMSGFERMGTAGEELRQKIKALSDNISSLEANTGRYQRNVGNYKSALEGLSGSFKAAGLSTKGLDQSLKLLNGNPIMLFLTAIVSIVRQLIQAFKGNEQAMMALKQAFSAFNPIIDASKRGLESFANIIVKVVTGAVNGLTSAIGWLLDRLQDIGDFFGADWHMGDNFRDGVAAAKELQEAENDYIKAKRAWSVESAKIDREVADLREKASDKEQYNAQQRLDYLNKAIALETRKAEKDKELAQQNLANLQAEAQRSANSASMNEKLAEAERAVIEADTRLADTKRNLNRQRQQAISEINGETAAIVKQSKAISEEITLVKELIRELPEMKKAMQIESEEKDIADQIVEKFEKADKAAQEAAKKTAAMIRDFEEKFGKFEVDDEGLEALERRSNAWYNFAQTFNENAETIEQTASALSSSFGSVASMYETMAKDESKSEEERAKAARKAKTWAGLQIAANSGTALAKGIAGAMDAPTVAGKIAALASIMAAVLSAIAQAKALAAESHEHGGVIGNKFVGATRGGDDVLTTARRGEMMLNADQQRRLFDIANGNSQTSIAESLFAAIQAMPAPTLIYSEFNDFRSRVATITENAKLK